MFSHNISIIFHYPLLSWKSSIALINKVDYSIAVNLSSTSEIYRHHRAIRSLGGRLASVWGWVLCAWSATQPQTDTGFSRLRLYLISVLVTWIPQGSKPVAPMNYWYCGVVGDKKDSHNISSWGSAVVWEWGWNNDPCSIWYFYPVAVRCLSMLLFLFLNQRTIIFM